MTSPTCNTCRHLIGRREYQENFEKWKCGNPNNIEGTGVNLVSGLPYTNYKITYCITQRLDPLSCGPEGLWYEEYIPPQQEPTIAGQAATEIVFDPEAIERNRQAAVKAMAEKRAKKLLGNIKADEL